MKESIKYTILIIILVSLVAVYNYNFIVGIIGFGIYLIVVWYLFKPERKKSNEKWKKLEKMNKKQLLKLLVKKYEKKDKREIMNEIIGRVGITSSR